MAYTLQDYFNTGDDNVSRAYGDVQYAQGFTTTSAYTSNKVVLLLYKIGTVTGDVVVALTAVSSYNNPEGADLATATVAASSLGTSSHGDWVDFTWSSPIALTNATKYAIVVRAAGGSSTSNCVAVRYDSTTSPYAGGRRCYSDNAGASWINHTGYDLVFEVYGETVVVYEDMAVTSGFTGGGSATLVSGAPVDMAVSSGFTGGGSALLLSHIQFTGVSTTRCIVVAGDDQIWYEVA